MQKDGYIRIGGRKEIRLTTKGLGIAETMARRHRLIERWLTDELGLDWSRAHDEAHRLEHSLSPVVEERLAEKLRMPSTCPHGNPIPACRRPRRIGRSLNQAPAGRPFVVERITEEAEADRQLLRFLWESGDPPGQPHRGERDRTLRGHVSIVLDGRTVTMGLSASNKIWVYDPMEPSPRPARRGARTVPPSPAPDPWRSGPLRAAERVSRVPADAPPPRRALPGGSRDPGHLLPDRDGRRDDPLRHRHLAARGPRPAAAGSPLPLQRRGPARAPARLHRARAQGRGPGGDQPPALRPRGRRGDLRHLRAGGAEGRVRLRPVPGGLLRLVLLPQELRPARLPLAPAQRRRGWCPRDRASDGHTPPPVAAGAAAGGRPVILAGDCCWRRSIDEEIPPGVVGPDAGDALDPAPEDARAAHRGRIFPSHDPAFWERAIKAPEAYK